MRFHKIEVDEEVFAYLQKRAEPLVDTPNNVLRRELLGASVAREKQSKHANALSDPGAMPELSAAIPMGLRQILEVVHGVRNANQTRSEATHLVARKYGVEQQTVIDKYCRQLDIQAYEFDQLLEQDSLEDLKVILKEKYVRHAKLIDDSVALVFQRIAAPEQRSILELQGLGKGVWSNVDARKYIDEERASWNG